MQRLANELRKLAEELEMDDVKIDEVDVEDVNIIVCPNCGHQGPACNFAPNVPAKGVGFGLGPGKGQGPGLGLGLGPGGGRGRRRPF